MCIRGCDTTVSCYNAGMAKKKSQSKSPAKPDGDKQFVCRNRKARHEYELLDELECGIVLTGSEVKSIRNGKISINEGFVRVQNGELWLVDCDIAEYPQATMQNHEPKRRRKLLMHKREFRKFAEQSDQKGLTMIPLSVYFLNGRVKVTIAVARGRKLYDKREKLKQRTDREELRAAKLKGR